MPSTAMPAAILSVSSSSCGWALAQGAGALAHRLGQQQLAARRRPEPVDRLERALVGDGEGADLLDVVAPELDAQRVLLGGREDVDDAAAHGELAALLDQVDARVRRVGEASYEVVERCGVTRGELDRLEVAEALDLRLEHRAHRGDDDAQRPVGGLVAGVPEAPQHREPAAHGVAAGAEPLVGQGLPVGVDGDDRRVDEVAQLGLEVLGLAGGRGHHEHRAPGVDEALDHERAQRRGAGQVEGGGGAVTRVGERGGEGRVGEDGVGQAGEVHEELLRGQHGRPPTATEGVGGARSRSAGRAGRGSGYARGGTPPATRGCSMTHP